MLTLPIKKKWFDMILSGKKLQTAIWRKGLVIPNGEPNREKNIMCLSSRKSDGKAWIT